MSRKQMKHRAGSRALCALFLAYLLSVAAFVLGIWLNSVFPDFDALPLFCMLFAAFAVACAANRVAAKVFARNHFHLHPDERQEMTARYIEECNADPEAVLRKHADMEVVPVFLLGLYFLLTLAIGVTGGMCALDEESLAHGTAAFVGVFACFILSYMPLLRLLEQIPHRLNRDALVPVESLPTLQGMAQWAADTVGVKGEIRMEITADCLCEVNRVGNTSVVFLGTRLLAVLTEEEMQASLLLAFEEFSHPKLRRQLLRRFRLGMLGAADIRRSTFAFDLFFSYADAYVEWEYELYYFAFRRYILRCGYERIRREGRGCGALGALTKKAFWPYFVFEFVRFVPTPYYESPTPPADYEQRVCYGFRTACGSRHNAWLDMLGRELSRPGDMGILFREERDMLVGDGGSLSVAFELPDLRSAYGEEIMTAIRSIADSQFSQESVETYQKEREREYLELLRTVEAYEASPEGYSTPELSPVINAYRDLGRIKEAEVLCDGIMERETNQFALAHAIYFKGMCMLHRYETEGIDLIYRAIDLNKNYMKDGFELVEEYCVLCGLADEFDTFRRRAEIQVTAHAYNHEGAGYLMAGDRLVKEDGLGDMLPDILGYMEQVSDGCIQQVYLVRKVVSEDFFTSAFVVNFEYGVPEEQIRRVYSAIFNYLDAYPVDWQFSLFVYDRDTERAVRQVADSLVWEKKQ